nr:hypothetical protein [Tanacetum cinerariifolium]
MAIPAEHVAHDAAAEDKIINDVAKYGFHVAIVPGDGYSPAFAYTIGLYETYGYPELICFGLPQDLLHSVLWSGKELLDKHPVPDQSLGYPDFIGTTLAMVSGSIKVRIFRPCKSYGRIKKRSFLGKKALIRLGRLDSLYLTAIWISNSEKSAIQPFLLPAKCW